jgi:hypothetical protein
MSDLDRANRLKDTRDRLAAALEDASTRDLPALSREYRLVMAELDELSGEEVDDAVDQLAARREAKTAPSTKRRAQ